MAPRRQCSQEVSSPKLKMSSWFAPHNCGQLSMHCQFIMLQNDIVVFVPPKWIQNGSFCHVLQDMSIFYYSECSVHLPRVSLSLLIFLYSSSLSDQSDAGEWDQVCGSRACGIEVRQHPCAVLQCSTPQCLGEFALINLIYYVLPWVTSTENSRPLIKAQLFWQATDGAAKP